MNEPIAIETPRFKLTLTPAEKAVSAVLCDKIAGVTWPAAPLAEALVYDKMERRTRRLPWTVDECRRDGDGAYLRLSLPYQEISIGLRLQPDGNELIVGLPMLECYELKPAIHRLLSVRLLPGLTSVGAAGTVLLPLQSGMIFHPAGKPAVADSIMIYGEQGRWELLPTVPLCGAAEAQAGLLWLATAAAAETECCVATDGRGRGTVGLGFVLRRSWPDPVCRDDRELRLIPFSPGELDLVNFAGQRLRRHVIEDLGKPTLAARAAESPQIRQLLESHLIRIFHGMQPIGMASGMDQKDVINLREPFVADTTFAEARDGLRRLHEAGVARMHVESIGWNPRGHDGMWPTRFPIEPRLGGAAGFRELIRYGHSLGCTMNVHDNYLSQYRSSPDFDPSIVMHDQWGTPDLRGYWGGGETYITCPWALGADRLDREMERVKALGLDGPAYVDGMGNPLECCYAPGPVGTRSDYVRGTQHIIETARRVYGAARTECGFLYACLPADCLNQCGNAFMMNRLDPDWPITALIETVVPVWQLALHGLVVRESHGVTWRTAIECVLFGDHPRHEWSAHGRFQPALDDAYVAAIKAQYDLCVVRYGHLQTVPLVAWSHLPEGLQETRFADGTIVTADLKQLALFVNGKPVERPRGLADDKK